MIILMLWIISLMLNFMSFFNCYSEPIINEQVIVNNTIINDFILEDDFVSSIPFVDNVVPELVQNMAKYINQNNVESYEQILHQMVVEKCKTQTNLDLNAYESHVLFLHSTFKKMYILNTELSVMDYYILDWAKLNISGNDFDLYKNLVLNSPNKVLVIN